MNYFFYNTDLKSREKTKQPRFKVLIKEGFAAVGGKREKYGMLFNQFEIGDILLMYENKVGVVSIGTVQERWDQITHNEPRYYRLEEMKNFTDGEPYEYRIKVNWFLDLSEKPITLAELKERLFIPTSAVKKIKEKRKEVARIIGELRRENSHLPEEIEQPEKYVEGACRKISVNAYERNPEARRRCIEHYGAKCCICDISFGAEYGDEAEGYIHVHHIIPLSEIGKDYIVDPIRDLRPVCPNCHVVIHLGRRSRTIEEVRQLLKMKKMRD